MKKLVVIFSFLIISITAISQKVSGKLKFEKGQTIEVSMQVKNMTAQQAMGQAIDFDAEGSAIQSCKVTSATNENTSLHQQPQKISFTFDGMGKKHSFDSDNQKDLDGQFGKPMKELLGKTYNIVLDPTGKILKVQPEKTTTPKLDGPMMQIGSMLKDLMDIMLPPKKDAASFFKVLPKNEVSKGESWADSSENVNGKFNTSYTLTDITDSTIVIDFTGNSVTKRKAEMMGNESTTVMNNKTTGKIILDKLTGIIREKTSTIESNGSTVVMRNTVPVTSKTTILIKVK